ncbi:MAG: hypothetical protein FWF09_04150, partial [Bacteroidales bacterium]|nr:hypothetical protein [Bacteroidales bacterium]
IDRVVSAGGLIGAGYLTEKNNTVKSVVISKCFFGGSVFCTSNGTVTGAATGNNIGGIIGCLDIFFPNGGSSVSSTLYVDQCFNFGEVKGNNNIGGIIGNSYFASNDNGTVIGIVVTNNYNSGMVSGNAGTATGGVGGIVGYTGSATGNTFVVMYNYNTGGVVLLNPSNNSRRANCIGSYLLPGNNSNPNLTLRYNFFDILNALDCKSIGLGTGAASADIVEPLPNVTSQILGDGLINNAGGLLTLKSFSFTPLPAPTTWISHPDHYPQLGWAVNLRTQVPGLSSYFYNIVEAASALSVLPVGVTYYPGRYDVRYRSYNISGTCYVPLIDARAESVTWDAEPTLVEIDDVTGKMTFPETYSGAATLTVYSTYPNLFRSIPVEINNLDGRTFITKPAWVDAVWNGSDVAGTSTGVSETGRARFKQFGKWVNHPTTPGIGFFDSPTADLEYGQCAITNIPKIYEIWYPAQLRALYKMMYDESAGTLADHFFYVMQDLDMGNEPWTPIGTTTASFISFAGFLDGNENKIKNLYINNTSTLIPSGLFSALTGARIENLYLSGNITAVNNVGGLAGQVNNNATLRNIGSEVNVSGGNNVGGLVGQIAFSAQGSVSIDFCYNKGSVSGAGGIGGIVGTGSSTAADRFIYLTNVFNYGAVTGNNAGGIVGSFSATTFGVCTITGCYNTAIIKGTNGVGGLAGTLSGSGAIVGIFNGYNVGNVYAGAPNSANIGGIAGTLTAADLTNTYNGSWVGAYVGGGSVNNSATNTGAIVGSNNGTLSNCYYDAQMSNFYHGAGTLVANTINMTAGTGFGDLGGFFFYQSGYYPQLNIFRNYTNPIYPVMEQFIRQASALSVMPVSLNNPDVAESVEQDFLLRSNTMPLSLPVEYAPHHGATKVVNQGASSVVFLDKGEHLESIDATVGDFTRTMEIWNKKEIENRRPWWAYDDWIWGGNVMYPGEDDLEDKKYSSVIAAPDPDGVDFFADKKRQEYALYPVEWIGRYDLGHGFVDGGTGTESDPYRIYYPAQLITISRIVNGQEPDFPDDPTFVGKYIKVMAPLKFGGIVGDAETIQGKARNTFPVIGINGEGDGENTGTEMKFSGTFDGGGFIMEDVYIAHETFTDEEEVLHTFNDGYNAQAKIDLLSDPTPFGNPVPMAAWGIFGDVDGGTIRYLALSESSIINGHGGYIGSLVGRLNGTMNDCFNYAHVRNSAATFAMGGLVGAIKPYTDYDGTGEQMPQTIENSFNRGSVFADKPSDATGGIVGEILNNLAGMVGSTTITHVYNTGGIHSSLPNINMGGLVGSVSNSETNVIQYSFNAGMILSSGHNLGGLVGSGSSGLTIEKSYSSGSVICFGDTYCGSIIGYLNGTTLTNLFYDKQQSPYHLGVGGTVASSDVAHTTAYTTGEFTGRTNGTTYQNIKDILGSSFYFYKDDNFFSYYPQLSYFYNSNADNTVVEDPVNWNRYMRLNSGIAAVPIYINEGQNIDNVTQDFDFPRLNGNDLNGQLIWEERSTPQIPINITGGYIHLPVLTDPDFSRVTLTATLSGVPSKPFMFFLRKRESQQPWWAYPDRTWGGNYVYVTQDYTQAIIKGDVNALDIGGKDFGNPIVGDLYGLKNGVLVKGCFNTANGILYVDCTFAEMLDPLQETCQRHDQFGYWDGEMEDFAGASHGLSREDPFTIYYPAQLVYLANNVNEGSKLTDGLGNRTWGDQTFYGFAGMFITQMDNLDMGGYSEFDACGIGTVHNENNKFTPIGLRRFTETTDETLGLIGSDVFRGSYTGNGYKIKDLYIDDDINDYVGLFGYADGVAEVGYNAEINHLFLSSGSVTSSNARYTGGIVGWAGPNLSFKNAINFADVTTTKIGGGDVTNEATRAIVGGIVGASHSNITHYTHVGKVTGIHSDAAGGIVGYLHSGGHGAGDLTIKESQNSGVIRGKFNVGGIVGYIDVTLPAIGIIQDCFVTDLISGEENVGGIIGHASDVHSVVDCAFYAPVKFSGGMGTPAYIGSIVGRLTGSTNFNNNFYSTQYSQYQGVGLFDGDYGDQTGDNNITSILGGINNPMYLTNKMFAPPWHEIFGFYAEIVASRDSDLADYLFGLPTNFVEYNRLISGFSAIYSLPVYLDDSEKIWDLTQDFELPSVDFPGVTSPYTSPYQLTWTSYLTDYPSVPFGNISTTPAESKLQPLHDEVLVYSFNLPMTTQPTLFNLFVTDDNGAFGNCPGETYREYLELVANKRTDTTDYKVCNDDEPFLLSFEIFKNPVLLPYTYQWYVFDEGEEEWEEMSGEDGETCELDAEHILDGADAGEFLYKCVITDKDNSTATFIARVKVIDCTQCDPEMPPPVADNIIVCYDENTYTCTADFPEGYEDDLYEIVWYAEEEDTETIEPPSLNIAGKVTAWAALRLKENPDCESEERTECVVEIKPLPTPIITGTDDVCLNIATTFTTDPDKTNYIWNVDGGTIIEGGAATDNTVTVSWNTTGDKTISVNYTDTNGCTAAPATQKTVIVKPLPTPIITGTDDVCLNIATTFTTESGKTNYAWNVDGGTVTAGGVATDNTVTVSWNTTGDKTISVNYTDTNGCTAATATEKTVIVKPLPTPIIGGTDDVCLNIATTFTTDPDKTNYA